MTRPDTPARYSDRLQHHLHDRFVDCPAALMNRHAGRACNIDVTCLAISSTDIRDQLAEGRNPRFLLPSTVLAYISKHGLYREK